MRGSRGAGKVRAVKKLFFVCLCLWSASGLSAGPAAPARTKISLLCTGWLPAYTSWEAPPAPTTVQSGQITVEIDRASGTLALSLAVTGDLVAPLEVSERYYSATAPQGRVQLGRSLDAVEISVNRLNGEARMRYMVGETGYPAFNGNCVAARPRS